MQPIQLRYQSKAAPAKCAAALQNFQHAVTQPCLQVAQQQASPYNQHSLRGTPPPPRHTTPTRATARNVGNRVKYNEDDGYGSMDSEEAEDEEAERRLADQKAAASVVPAFLTTFDGLDDEVERVLGHRSLPARQCAYACMYLVSLGTTYMEKVHSMQGRQLLLIAFMGLQVNEGHQLQATTEMPDSFQ